MNLSKRQLDNKYVHRALTDMGAYKKNTRDLKRIFTDKSRKYKGNKMLKARYVDAFKARCSALEFDEHFTSMKNTFPNGRVTKTYSIEAGDDWLRKSSSHILIYYGLTGQGKTRFPLPKDTLKRAVGRPRKALTCKY